MTAPTPERHIAEKDATCEAWEAATVGREGDQPYWIDTPPHTHVDPALLEVPGARDFLTTRYELGEMCSRLGWTTIHAHRVTSSRETDA